jgi:hypothetical protein
VADGWCWFVLREEYCWLVAGGWFVVREKYCWLVADKPGEQAAYLFLCILSTFRSAILAGRPTVRHDGRRATPPPGSGVEGLHQVAARRRGLGRRRHPRGQRGGGGQPPPTDDPKDGAAGARRPQGRRDGSPAAARRGDPLGVVLHQERQRAGRSTKRRRAAVG